VANDEEIAELEVAVSDDPHRRSLRLELANALLHAGRYVDCLEHVRHLLAVAPGDPRALGIGALAADLCGDPAAAGAYAAMMRTAVRPTAESSASSADVELTVPLVNLGDVDGYSEEKRRLDQAILRTFRLRKTAEGGRVPTGILLYGPTGSAKSHLAHALAGELHLNLVKVNVVDAIDPWGAALPGSIRAAFELAAQNAPAMVFLEDVEAVAHRRLRFTPRGREALDELIEVLDANDPTKVLVVGSTASPWQLNPNLRQEGRFTKCILVGPPDLEARQATLERHLRSRVLPFDVDLTTLAARTEGCTTDDLIRLCASAAEGALRESVDSGIVKPISQAHFLTALGSVTRSAHAWFDVAYNSSEFTDDTEEYDPLFDYIRRNVRRLI
jgi:SpoVK/Ycf46/Vps4 family AAA+-type ATPase